jgi:hypothetical protein
MRPCALALLAAAMLVAGCGGQSDADKAESTVSTAVSSLAKGNAQKVCDQLTPGAQRKVLAVLATGPLGLAPIRADTCVQAVGELHDALPKVIRNVLVDGEVGDAQIKGDKAKVHVVGAGMTADVQRFGDSWKITGGLFQ